MIMLLIFDWGGTVMMDYDYEGPMYLCEKVDYVPGVKNALELLSEKYICCIATNADYSGRDELIRALERIDAARFFKSFFSSKDIGFEKPDKGFFLFIANEMAVKPTQCIMIGNSYLKDIEGAKEAGMKTVFYNENNIIGEFSAADIIITGMEELVNGIQEIIEKNKDVS